MGVVVANAAATALGLVDHEHHEMAEHIETACLTYFACEMGVRVWLARADLRGWMRNGWNVFDALVTGMAMLPFLGAGVAVLRLGRLARLVHLTRHAANLRGLDLLRR
ncbi:ion transporter [Mycolicibacterium septicum]|uniref:ion transporter n=1 Tax=Mycolicibacterium septicum TaxID=98668 RepID=UPI002362D8E4|nr:ion transporter [Mycolicibacterium septicum]